MAKNIGGYLLIVLLVVGASTASIADEQPHRKSFSSLGVGVGYLDYEESAGSIQAIGHVQSEAEGSSVFQRSGAYVAINHDWGFYFNSSGLIGTNVIDEDWSASDIKVQENYFSLDRSTISVLITKHLGDYRHYALFGAGTLDKSYVRFGQKYNQNTPDALCCSTQTVTEDVSQYVAYFGYEYNEFFTGSELGLKFNFQAMMGVPFYSETVNSSLGDRTFDASMDGYIFDFSASAGWQMSQNFLASFTLGYTINRRDEDKVDFTTEINGQQIEVSSILPRSHFWILTPSFNLHWSF